MEIYKSRSLYFCVEEESGNILLTPIKEIKEKGATIEVICAMDVLNPKRRPVTIVAKGFRRDQEPSLEKAVSNYAMASRTKVKLFYAAEDDKTNFY